MEKAKVFLLFFVTVFFFSGAVKVTQAADTVGIKISPTIIEDKVEPGQVFSSVLHVTNLGAITDTFYIIKKNIENVKDDGSPIFAEEKNITEYKLISWISATEEPIYIPANETREIPFTVTVPVGATPGGHFAGLIVTTMPSQLEEIGSSVAYGATTIISLRINGEINEQANIREFRTDKPIYSQPKIQFITRVENIGNVLARVYGPIEINNMFGKKIAILMMNESGSAIFPKTIRQFESTWNGKGFHFGRYQAIMSLVYGEEDRQTISSVLIFWILPLNIILPSIAGIICFILIVYFATRLYVRKKLQSINRLTKTGGHYLKTGGVSQSQYNYPSQPLSKLTLIVLVLLGLISVFLVAMFIFFS